MADALTSKGTTLQVGAHDVVNVIGITGPTQTAATVDVTHLGVTGSYRQFLSGYLDGGEVTFELYFDPSKSSHKEAVGGIKHHYNLGDSPTWTYTLSDASVITFAGTVVGFAGPDAGVDEGLKVSVTVKVDGAVTMPS